MLKFVHSCVWMHNLKLLCTYITKKEEEKEENLKTKNIVFIWKEFYLSLALNFGESWYVLGVVDFIFANFSSHL